MRTVVDLDEYMVLFAFGASVLFVVVCSLVWRWWRTVWGRTSVAISAALSLALFPATLHFLLGVNTAHLWFAWYYAVSLGAVGVIELWRLVVVVREQRRGRGGRQHGPADG